MQFLCGKHPFLARLVQKGCRNQNILNLTAVGARIHIYRAAHAARNTKRKFHAGKTLVRRHNANAGQRRACFGCQDTAVANDPPHCPANADDHTVKALVSKENVGSVSQQIIPHAVCTANCKGPRKLPFVLRLTEQARRPADLEAGMMRQPLLHGARDRPPPKIGCDLIPMHHNSLPVLFFLPKAACRLSASMRLMRRLPPRVTGTARQGPRRQ